MGQKGISAEERKISMSVYLRKGNDCDSILIGYVKIATWGPMDDMFSEEAYYKNKHDLRKSCNPKEVVLPPNKKYTLVISYPVSVDCKKIFLSGHKGMTRSKLTILICRAYRRMYENEAKSSKIHENTFSGNMSRNHTKGMYGIWGHHIEDLTLISVIVDGNQIRPIVE
jgi:hypothetical protein